jgi:hypothetical protein
LTGTTPFLIVVLALLSACGSTNPDALNDTDIDQNPAGADTNVTMNGEVNEEPAAVVDAPELAAPAPANTDQANIDAAVNSHREVDAEQNALDEAEGEFTSEEDDPGGY